MICLNFMSPELHTVLGRMRALRWRHAHLERARKNSRNWNARNKSKCRASDAAYRERNPHNHARLRASDPKVVEYDRAYSLAWQRANPEKIKTAIHNRRARIKNSGGSHTTEQWLALKEFYNNECYAAIEEKLSWLV